ncbi:MAG: InlB B-repeat-containing protein, partial [Bifidobacteriaceae bacterium]|nr:InlB B-repeat-containing protein [Bifidobacteriaceae bacterium]
MNNQSTLQRPDINRWSLRQRFPALVALAAMLATMFVASGAKPAQAETCGEFAEWYYRLMSDDPLKMERTYALSSILPHLHWDSEHDKGDWNLDALMNKPYWDRNMESMWYPRDYINNIDAYHVDKEGKIGPITRNAPSFDPKPGMLIFTPPTSSDPSLPWHVSVVTAVTRVGDTYTLGIIESGIIRNKGDVGFRLTGEMTIPANQSGWWNTVKPDSYGRLQEYYVVPRDGLITKQPPSNQEILADPKGEKKSLKLGNTGGIGAESVVFKASGTALPVEAPAVAQGSNLPANATWEAFPESPWVTVSPVAGALNGTLTVDVAANPSASGRETVIRVEWSNGVISWIGVRQQRAPRETVVGAFDVDSGATWNLTLPGRSYEGEGEARQVSWAATSDATWAKLDQASGTGTRPFTFQLKVTNSANATGAARTATIKVEFSDTWDVYTWTITQPPTSAYHDTWTAGEGGWANPGTLNFSTTKAWTATSSASWATISQASGIGNASVRVSVAANTLTEARSATVTIKIDGATYWVVTINQAGAVVQAYTWTVGAGGWSNPGTVDVSTTKSWTATSSASWVTVTPASGIGSATVRMYVAANTLTAARSATVTIKVDGTTYSVDTINQAAGAVKTDSWTVGATGWSSPGTLSLSTTKAWTATSSAPWVTVSPASGTGNGSVNVYVAANTSTAARSATVTIKIDGATYWVKTINQAGAASAATYTVAFNPQGGPAVGSVARSAGQALGVLPAPVRVGFRFDGWFTAASGGSQVSASTVVSGNVTYYARWTAAALSITGLGYEGQTVTASTAQSGVTGYQWTYLADGSAAPGGSGNKYTVGAADFSGTEGRQIRVRVLGPGNAVLQEEWFRPTHQRLKGWVSAADLTSPGAGQVKIAASWAFDWASLGATSRMVLTVGAPCASASAAQRYGFGSPWSANAAWSVASAYPRVGGGTYWFNGLTVGGIVQRGDQAVYLYAVPAGWDGSCGQLVQFDGSGKSKTLYLGAASAATYTVAFNPQGGTGAGSRTVAAGSPVGTLPAPTKPGYTLKGWFTAPTGGTQVTAATIVTGNVT